MFQNINGVQIKENDETKDLPNLIDKRFEIEYIDHVYLHKLLCFDFINLEVGVLPTKSGKHTLSKFRHE